MNTRGYVCINRKQGIKSYRKEVPRNKLYSFLERKKKLEFHQSSVKYNYLKVFIWVQFKYYLEVGTRCITSLS